MWIILLQMYSRTNKTPPPTHTYRHTRSSRAYFSASCMHTGSRSEPKRRRRKCSNDGWLAVPQERLYSLHRRRRPALRSSPRILPSVDTRIRCTENMNAPLDPQEARRLAESSGQIHMHAFQVRILKPGGDGGSLLWNVTDLHTGSPRSFDRLGALLLYRANGDPISVSEMSTPRRRIFILAAGSLCAATGIMYNICYFLYLHTAALLIPQLLPIFLLISLGCSSCRRGCIRTWP